MSDAHNEQDQAGFYTNLSVGEILRRTRVYHNLDLEQVSADLRIRTAQLDAIESSAFDELPGRVYAIGFIRNYAEYLGLDGEKIIALFKTQEGGRQTEPELNFPVPASESRMPNIRAIGGAGLLLIGLSAAWFWLVRDNNSSAALSISEVPASLDKEVNAAIDRGRLAIPRLDKTPAPDMTVEDNAIAAGQQEKPKPEQRESNAVVLKASSDAWVEIRNEQDEVIFSQILKKGQTYSVPDDGKKPHVMATGNAGGIQVVMDGRTLDSLGARGEVKRGIELNVKALKAFSKQE